MSQKANLALPDRLIEEGERLFGMHGLDGVSLRQISTAAGTKNNFAVQYHFGDVPGLIRAILARRVPEFEMRRANLLAKLPMMEEITTYQLVVVLFRPFFDIGPVASRFLLMIRTSQWGWRELAPYDSDMSITNRLMEMMDERNLHVPKSVMRDRLKKITYMILAIACGAESEAGKADTSEAMLRDVFDMVTGALSASVDSEFERALIEQGGEEG